MPPLTIEVVPSPNPNESLVIINGSGHSNPIPSVLVPRLLAHDALVEVAREYLITCRERIRTMDEEHAEANCDGDYDEPCEHIEIKRHYEALTTEIEAALKLAGVEEQT